MSGELDYEEMYVLAEFMGIPKILMKEWIKEIDSDGDGNIQQNEFHKYLRDTNQSYKNQNKEVDGDQSVKDKGNLFEDLLD